MQQTKETNQELEDKNDFLCAVCYGTDNESGIVIPKRCSHKICLDCYSKIIIKHKFNARCPTCRSEYLEQEENEFVEAEENAVQNEHQNNDNFIVDSTMDYMLNMYISPYTVTTTVFQSPDEHEIISYYVLNQNNTILGQYSNNVIM